MAPTTPASSRPPPSASLLCELNWHAAMQAGPCVLDAAAVHNTSRDVEFIFQPQDLVCFRA